jgi:hypothetical protein
MKNGEGVKQDIRRMLKDGQLRPNIIYYRYIETAELALMFQRLFYKDQGFPKWTHEINLGIQTTWDEGFRICLK